MNAFAQSYDYVYVSRILTNFFCQCSLLNGNDGTNVLFVCMFVVGVRRCTVDEPVQPAATQLGSVECDAGRKPDAGKQRPRTGRSSGAAHRSAASSWTAYAAALHEAAPAASLAAAATAKDVRHVAVADSGRSCDAVARFAAIATTAAAATTTATFGALSAIGHKQFR